MLFPLASPLHICFRPLWHTFDQIAFPYKTASELFQLEVAGCFAAIAAVQRRWPNSRYLTHSDHRHAPVQSKKGIASDAFGLQAAMQQPRSEGLDQFRHGRKQVRLQRVVGHAEAPLRHSRSHAKDRNRRAQPILGRTSSPMAIEKPTPHVVAGLVQGYRRPRPWICVSVPPTGKGAYRFAARTQRCVCVASIKWRLRMIDNMWDNSIIQNVIYYRPSQPMRAPLLKVHVQRKHTEAVDICTLELVSAEGDLLPAFSAGSHIDVYLPGGVVRQYSLCNPAGETHSYQISVLKDPTSRGGSQAIHEQVHVDDILTISAPKNHFALAHEARHSVLLAGGIGITPILCMAERLSTAGESFEMHYCTRSRERTAFLERLRNGTFASRVAFYFDDEGAAQKLDLNAVFANANEGVHLYVCGPKGFMDAALGAARANGWPEDRLHYEFFSAEPVKLESDGGFKVQLASSGRTVNVAKEQTVVEALEQAGVSVMTSCGQGTCGTCLTRVLEGEPDHRDCYLSPEEHARNDQFLPCCSRAKSPVLVLDL